MPLRMLRYYAKSYKKTATKKDIYGRRLIKIPRPEFIVFYNGREKFQEQKILKLSDAFIQTGKEKKHPNLELEVRVVNINKGHNVSILRKSKALLDYSEFIAKIREFESKGCEDDDAMMKAISYCIDKGILRDFLQKHSAAEVIGMLRAIEFNIEDAKSVWREEAIEEGIEIGIAQGIAKGEARGIAKGEARGIAKGEARGEARTLNRVKKLLQRGLSGEALLRAIDGKSVRRK